MNTQNVNVKTATGKSSERWVETPNLRTDGFVRNIHSSNAFDVISADVVLEGLEKQAQRVCGLHYEIFHSRLLRMAMDYLEALPLKDRPIFVGAASLRGYSLTQSAAKEAYEAEAELIRELEKDY